MNTEVEILTAFELFTRFRVVYNEKKTAIQAEIEAEQYQLGLLQDQLHILERKRKSKYKQDHIENKKVWITRKENDIERCEDQLFRLEMKNNYETEKLKKSGEIDFEIVERKDTDEPFMTYYNITEKVKLPIVEHTD
jgi:hypothetical protein